MTKVAETPQYRPAPSDAFACGAPLPPSKTRTRYRPVAATTSAGVTTTRCSGGSAWKRSVTGPVAACAASTLARKAETSETLGGVKAAGASDDHSATRSAAVASRAGDAVADSSTSGRGVPTKAAGVPTFWRRLVSPPTSHAGCLKSASASAKPKRTPSAFCLPTCHSWTCWCAGSPSVAPSATASATPSATATRITFFLVSSDGAPSVGLSGVRRCDAS